VPLEPPDGVAINDRGVGSLGGGIGSGLLPECMAHVRNGDKLGLALARVALLQCFRVDESLGAGLVREQVARRDRAVSRNARGDRPDHERQDARKEAEAEHAVFACSRDQREEGDQE
jgi:hypothetical protein